MRVLSAAVISVLCAGAAQAQTVLEFHGTWRLEASATRVLTASPETRLVAKELTVAGVGDRFTVDRVVGPLTGRGTYDLALGETSNSGLRGEPRASTARWEGTTLVIADTETVPQPHGTATVRVTERWTLQLDGSLLVEITSVTAVSTLTRTYRYLRVGL